MHKILYDTHHMQKDVKKRDGSTEAYEEDKIARVVTTAGLAPDKAHGLAAAVSAWVNSLPDTHISRSEERRVGKECRL